MKVSIVIPVYNAGKSLEKVVHRIVGNEYLKSIPFELILVDDKSEDDSFKIIQELADVYPNLLGITLHKNSGQHCATFVGIKEAKGEYLVTMDDDGEHPVDQIESLIELLEKDNRDIVYATPKKRTKTLFRKLASGIFKITGKLAGGYGKGSAFRVIHSSVFKQLQNLSVSVVYIDEILSWYTMNVGFLPIEFPTSLKKSTYKRKNLFSLYHDIVYAYSSFPAQLLTKLGFFSSILSLIFGLFFIIKKLFFRAQIGFTALAVSVLFSASIILFGLGILAQYAYRQSRILNQLPQYSIKKRTDGKTH